MALRFFAFSVFVDACRFMRRVPVVCAPDLWPGLLRSGLQVEVGSTLRASQLTLACTLRPSSACAILHRTTVLDRPALSRIGRQMMILSVGIVGWPRNDQCGRLQSGGVENLV